MYLPYLRGRQYELLALRELAENDLIGNKVTPIIEPIKPSSTLIKTITQFVDKNKDIALVLNPKVGNFNKELEIVKNDKFRDQLISAFEKPNVIISHILNSNSVNEINMLVEQGHKKNEILMINKEKDCLNFYLQVFQEEYPRYNLIPEESSFRRKIRHNKVLIADRFEKQSRNADYLSLDDESFSEDHIFYKEDGFIGFSDYSIVGEGYFESGFAPYAVAIHIVFFDENKCLRVKHFVSNSNEDYNDPAGKFYEALKKLALWQEKEHINTFGLREFMKHYHNGTYPGLGTVKKLSIMHHIELVSKYLDGVE
ncbi:sce7725 family protein [Peribacillus sp. TH27]|uniref:sce7725 family protein n=1 Tax=Peribacillus sp. TH27 TaxID=2798484 RepID=UPI0019124FE9|nr:sce7725 family protein [Peribacillus sp. TH27]MBK5458048.1 sce7725 family protein [Peribacillus sp. TH27]